MFSIVLISVTYVKPFLFFFFPLSVRITYTVYFFWAPTSAADNQSGAKAERWAGYGSENQIVTWTIKIESFLIFLITK